MELLVREAEAKGVSLSALLRSIVEEHFGAKPSKPIQKPFIVELEEVFGALGRAKLDKCPMKEGCLLRGLGVKPSPIACALCQIHSHTAGFLQTSTFNPYDLG
jgi:hypothetical protein